MLPQTLHKLTSDDVNEITARTRERFFAEAQLMAIDYDLEQELGDIYIPLAATLKEKTQHQGSPLVVGINGAQGAGKSAFCRLLQIVLEQGFGQRVISFSIDDIYLTCAERQKLARPTGAKAGFGHRPTKGSHDHGRHRARAFLMNYERLTRAMLDEMPERAQLVLELNSEHQIDAVRLNVQTAN